MGLIFDFVNCKNKLKIAVCGDSIIDEYYYVQVNRLSPEFPIPVWLSAGDDMRYALPGGAANVAYQFRHFCHDVHLVSFVNPAAATVYDNNGVHHQHSWHGCCQVPVKRRLYQEEFPLCRWDIEQPNYDIASNEPYRHLKSFVPKEDVVIFSDYHKGVFDEDWFRSIIDSGVTTIVDPKRDIDKWAGCTIFKPNSVEAEKLSGEKSWQIQAAYFMDRLKCQSVVITQGGDGVVGRHGDKEFEYRPRRRSGHVNSLQGAGDCFMAFLAMAVGHGFSISDAAEIAFEAGTIYVQNRHNEPIKPEQLWHREDPSSIKFVAPEFLRNRNYRLTLCNGCFDILHKGHLDTLEFAKSQGDKLVVAVNSDQSVNNLKGGDRPVNTLEHRMQMLAALQVVDFVIPFGENTPLDLIQKIKPDVLVKGGDYKKEDVVGYGIVPEIIIAPTTPGFSTTSILDRLKND